MVISLTEHSIIERRMYALMPPGIRRQLPRFASARFATMFCFCASLLTLVHVAQVSAQAPGASAEAAPYPQQGVSAGVWNSGQASFWDIDLFDHFRIFGATERAKGYRPEQPIKFSHVTHVQKNKMECQYCHWNVAKTAYATIPEVETCMGCHTMITLQDGVDDKGQPKAKAGKEQGFLEIKKLKELYWDKKVTIDWEKVHVMPDHVRFNHKRHVKAGVGCQECHGQVPEMEVVQRVSSMKMGWCVDCHRQRGASIDCYVCHK